MCGICGFLDPDIKQESRQNILQTMTHAIHHRGPDSDGFFIRDNVGLGIKRLKIIDLESGDQPIFNEAKDICLVFNGEIYNYRELREELSAKGHKFYTKSDTEVIVHLYEDYGVNCLKKLNGFFGLAIYDLKKDLIFLARDRLGIKPLHYYRKDKTFLFGSEIKSFFPYPGADFSIDYNSLNKYLTFDYVPAPYTIFKHVRKLRQGHYLIYQNGEFAEHKYWGFPEDNPDTLTEKEYIEELEKRLVKSVNMRLVSDVPLGCFLSGGIDSSLITAIIARNNGSKVKTFSINFEEKSFDESVYSRRVAQYLDTEHHEETFGSKKLLDVMPTVVGLMEEPFADASLMPTYLLSQFARKYVTVALSGDGGDELFAGYPTYQALKLANYIPQFLVSPLKKLVDMIPVSDSNISFDFKLKKFFSALQYEPSLRNQLWLGSFGPEQKAQLLHNDIKQEISGDEFQIIYDNLNNRKFSDDLKKILYLDCKFYLQDNMLVKVDRASMANSLEVRVPFLDHELVEFIFNIPTNLKLKGFKTKYIQKKLAEKYLPPDIYNRKKKGFGIPIAKWIKKDLKELVLDLLSKENVNSDGIFNHSYIEKLLNEHLENKFDHRKLLWSLIIFQLWRQNWKSKLAI